MALDLQDSYGSIEEKIKAGRTYLEVKQSAIKLKNEAKDNLEQAKNLTTTTVDKLKEQKKRYQRQIKTQMDHMLSTLQFNSGAGGASLNYVKAKFIEVLLRIGPKIFDSLVKESIHSLGCSAQQAFDGTQTLYIKVKSTDIINLLKKDPTVPNSAAAYEKLAPFTNQYPFSMNWEMWDRLQHLNQPYPIYGASGQKLFDITYVQQDGNAITGDFYKIDLVNRIGGVNTVSNFLIDYYKNINLVDTTNIFAQLMDMITGAISIDAKIGTGEIEIQSKFLLILQRILGLCFDSKKEIDVSGISKVAELDGVDESFFEFSDIDLRNIEQRITNIKKQVVEFEECQNVLLPVDTQSIIDGINNIGKVTKIEEQQKLAESLTDILTENERWRLLVPNSVDIKLTVDLSFLKNIPKAIFMSLLSPKVLLPILIMSKAIGQTVADLIGDFLSFAKLFSRFTIAMMSIIGALFIQELFKIIKRDIKRLVNEIITDIAKEKIMKKYAMILKLIQIILIIAKFIDDWRKCKSVVDEILALLNLISSGGKKGGGVPSFILAASELLDGFSNTRAAINIIEEFQKIGLPTGPMPDGSPNLVLQSELARVTGLSKEWVENGKAQIFVKPLTVTPAFVTLPTGDIYGKWY